MKNQLFEYIEFVDKISYKEILIEILKQLGWLVIFSYFVAFEMIQKCNFYSRYTLSFRT